MNKCNTSNKPNIHDIKMKYLIVILVFLSSSCSKMEKHDIDYYKQIFNLERLSYEQIEAFVVIEEYQQSQKSNRIGIVICNTQKSTNIFTYSIDLEKANSLKLSDDYSDKTNPYYDQRVLIYKMALTNIKLLSELERTNSGKEGELNYLIAYNDKSEYTRLKRITLYDLVLYK